MILELAFFFSAIFQSAPYKTGVADMFGHTQLLMWVLEIEPQGFLPQALMLAQPSLQHPRLASNSRSSCFILSFSPKSLELNRQLSYRQQSPFTPLCCGGGDVNFYLIIDAFTSTLQNFLRKDMSFQRLSIYKERCDASSTCQLW